MWLRVLYISYARKEGQDLQTSDSPYNHEESFNAELTLAVQEEDNLQTLGARILDCCFTLLYCRKFVKHRYNAV